MVGSVGFRRSSKFDKSDHRHRLAGTAWHRHGAAMVHGIVHEHGGHVVVDSSPGRSSRFRVLWPALPPDVHETSMSPGAFAASERRPRPAMTGSVLVVDDEAAVGEFMRELLETRGLQAMFLPQGQAALELLSRDSRKPVDPVALEAALARVLGEAAGYSSGTT